MVYSEGIVTAAAAVRAPQEEDLLRVHPGDVLQLQIANRDDEEDSRYYVRAIGYVPNRSIIVSAPVKDGKAVRLINGCPLVARVLSAHHVRGFNCIVLYYAKQPYPYMHLSIPEALEAVKLRQAPRVQVSLVAAVRHNIQAGQKMTLPVRIADLSTTGASLRTRASLGQIGDDLSLSVELPVAESTHVLSVNAHVQGIDPPDAAGGPESALWRTGIQFEDLKAEEKLKLHGFVFERLFYGSR
ncbi:MAG: flagellar brake protein [Pseudomonadota bacterium]|nr:flagellar brake protein [Pseudomonadota bacterium]